MTQIKKQDIVKDISEALEVPQKTVEAVLDDFAGLVIDRAKAGDETSWPALGKFTGRRQAARTGINPATGQPLKTPAKTVLKFSPGAKVKRQVNGEE